MKTQAFHLHSISGLHVGTGQGIGVIDMPIARERASNLPLVPGSGIKGVLRDECKDRDDIDKKDYIALFGPEAGDNASDFAGALSVSDARLLCLPIRSWSGTFAWVTCPMILQRYQRDLQNSDSIPKPDDDKSAYTSTKTALIESDKIYLEDLDLNKADNNTDIVDKWAEFIANQIFTDDNWKSLFKERFLIVSDNTFDFLSETATEIRARIRIKEDTRTVQQGALWYEEYLPAETLLWGIIGSDNARDGSKKNAEELMKILPTNNTRIQIGGNATIGAGQVRWILSSHKEKAEGGEQ